MAPICRPLKPHLSAIQSRFERLVFFADSRAKVLGQGKYPPPKRRDNAIAACIPTTRAIA